jgi:hypothetical protein
MTTDDNRWQQMTLKSRHWESGQTDEKVMAKVLTGEDDKGGGNQGEDGEGEGG